MSRPVGVFIPTLNAGPRFGAVLDAVARQRGVAPRILVIDSGSTDGTLDVLRDRGIAFESIPEAEFDHGETRNRGIAALDEEFTALLSQDAEPVGDDYLARLLEPFEDARVAGTYAAQRPRPDCHPFQRINVARHMGDAAARVVREPLTADEFEALAPSDRVERIRFDNVASMVRREAVTRTPFPRASFGEDLAWARAVVTSGRAVVFCRDAEVLHSHAVDRAEFSDRVHAVHATLRRLTDFVPMEHRGWWLRRTLGCLVRFLRAAATDERAGWGLRAQRCMAALRYAPMQMEAMYRGSRAAAYESPR